MRGIASPLAFTNPTVKANMNATATAIMHLVIMEASWASKVMSRDRSGIDNAKAKSV
jgi:hypothetical protein